MRLTLLYLALFIGSTSALVAQITLSVTIDSATVATTCDDIFSAPDETYQVSIAGEAVVTYDPVTNPCFTSAPFLQYTTDVVGGCNLPATLEVCFTVFENDGLFFTCQVNPDCAETLCEQIPVPGSGSAFADTLVIGSGASTGELFLTISASIDSNDFNLPCGAVDLGVLNYGSTVGDLAGPTYDNNCADNLNEIQPTDLFVNLFNDHGVWFKFTTGPEAGPLQVVSVLNDPNATGDEIDAEIMVFTADSCTGTMSRYPLFIQRLAGMDSQLELLCPRTNQEYYILVDGAGGDATQQGVFSIAVSDAGLPFGADLKCDADDLGIVPEGGTTASPTPVGNFCATFAGDPFVRNFISRNSVWFTFRAPSSGHIRVDAVSSAIDPIDLELALYRSNLDTCDSFLSHLYSGRDASSFDESFVFSCLDPGRQYWILVDGAGTESVGYFDLSVTDMGDIRPVTMQSDTICFGEQFVVGPFNHDTTGVYVDTIKIDGTNCDSIIITDLFVWPALQLSVAQTRPAIGAAGTDGIAEALIEGGTGNLEISWCGGPFAAVGSSPVTFNQLEAGATCCVVLRDDFGCQADTCFVVDFVPPFQPFSSTTPVLCNGDSTGTLTFGVTGSRAPYFYQWSHTSLAGFSGMSVFLADGDALTVNDLPTGDYTIRIRDLFFDSTFTATITEPAVLAVAISNVAPISCFQACDGSVSISISGGVGNYSIDTIAPVPFGCPGNYVFTVTDENGCLAQVSTELIEPVEFVVTAAEVENVTCFAGSDGRIALTSNGNPTAFAWNHGPTTATVTDLAAGTYTVTVTNDDGCEDVLSQVIDQPLLPLQLDFTEVNPITCAVDADGILRADVIGGEGEITYLWSNGQTTQSAVDLGPGNYQVSVTDARGCEAIGSFNVQAPPPLFASVAVRNLRCPDPENAGQISVPVAEGGVGPYLYALNNQSFGVDSLFTGLTANAYEVTVQDALGCEFSIQTSVNPPPVLLADLGTDQEILLGDSVRLVLATNSDDLVYAWSFDAGLQSSQVVVRPAESSRISVTIRDTLTDCTTSSDVYLMVDGRPRVYVPNAFSPNGDGVNDIFFPFGGTDVLMINGFRVFDRYGSLVFEAAEDFSPNAPVNGWNGLVNGREASLGVYVYTASVRFFDGREEVVKGEVVLMR